MAEEREEEKLEGVTPENADESAADEAEKERPYVAANVYIDQMNSLVDDDGEYLCEPNELRLDKIESEEAKVALKKCYDSFKVSESVVSMGNPYKAKRAWYMILAVLLIGGSVPMFIFGIVLWGVVAAVVGAFFVGFSVLSFRAGRKLSRVQFYRRSDRNVLLYIRPYRDLTYYRAANATMDANVEGECFVPETPTNFTTLNARFIFGMMEGPLSVDYKNGDVIITALDRSIDKRKLTIGPDGRPKRFEYENSMSMEFVAFDDEVTPPPFPDTFPAALEEAKITPIPEDLNVRFLSPAEFAEEYKNITL